MTFERKRNILLLINLVFIILSFSACGGKTVETNNNSGKNATPSTLAEMNTEIPGSTNDESNSSGAVSDINENKTETDLGGTSAESSTSSNIKSTPNTQKYIALGDELGNKITSDLAISFIQKSRKKILINREGMGPNNKLSGLSSNKKDIGFLARRLTDEEKALKLSEEVIGYDAIAVIVNNNCQVKDLSVDKVRKLLKGEIKNWSELGGNGGQIQIKMNQPTVGSQIISILNCLFGLDTKTLKAKNISFCDGDAQIINEVSQNENIIGLVSFNCIDNAAIYPIDIDGVEPSMDNLLSGKYKLSIPFNVLYTDNIKPDMKDFISYLLGPDGQKSIASKGYYPIKN
jgi:phosphate transport system substrate-binding protein